MLTDSSDKIPLKIKRFNPSNMKPHSTMVMLGKRGSGKSTIVKDLCYHLRDLPAGCVMSGTEIANGFYKDILPSILIKEEYKKQHIQNVLARQLQMKKRVDAGEKVDSRAFLIMDDCMESNSWVKDKEIRCVFLNGRHYKLTFLLTMQYPLGIPPVLRTNTDYVFILRDNDRSNKEKIFKSYAGIFPNFNVFQQVMNKLTANYGCLVIDNTCMSNNFIDCIYWYKADVRGHFKMCDESLWKLDESYKRKKETNDKDNEADDDQTDELINMRKSPRVYVQKLMESR